MRVAVGGMIASGKSTLVKKLGAALNVPYMDEFAKEDPVFNTLLKWLYEGMDDVEMLLQVYFLHKHWKTQKEFTENVIIDRHMIEHWLFAQNNISDTTIKNFYNGIFNAYMNDIKPIDLYIILDVDWPTFETRLKSRGRQQEIDNFDANIDYFKTLLKDYVKMLEAQCLIHHVPYAIVDANVDDQAVLEKALELIAPLK